MNDYEKLSLEILRSTPGSTAMLADRPASPERRRFLQMLGGGLLIGVTLNTALLRGADAEEAATVGPRRPRNELPKDFNAFLHIAEDGKITAIRVRHEDAARRATYEKALSAFVGQGAKTATQLSAPRGLANGADWVKVVSRAVSLSAEAILMFDKAERARTAFDL